MNWISLGFVVLLTLHWLMAAAGTIKALSGKVFVAAEMTEHSASSLCRAKG